MAAGSCLVPRPPPITFQLSSDHLTQSWHKREGHEAEGRLGRPSAKSGIFPLLQILLRSQLGGFRSWRGSNHLLSHPTKPSLTQSTGRFRPALDSQGWKLAVRGQTVFDVLLVLFGEGQSSCGAKQNHITLGWLSARGPRLKASAFFPNTQAKHWGTPGRSHHLLTPARLVLTPGHPLSTTLCSTSLCWKMPGEAE